MSFWDTIGKISLKTAEVTFKVTKAVFEKLNEENEVKEEFLVKYKNYSDEKLLELASFNNSKSLGKTLAAKEVLKERGYSNDSIISIIKMNENSEK